MLTDMDKTPDRERREEILGAMLRAAAARRRQRALCRGAMWCVPLAVAGGVLILTSPGRGMPQRSPSAQGGEAPPLPQPGPSTAFAAGGSSSVMDLAHAIVDRRISDDELASLLRESGSQMGLVRVGHEVRLVPWNPASDKDSNSVPTTIDPAS
ncbi:MAG: hypothetical protein KJZ65_11185 [Phycisphaerales bacterium]|nr:hypothetical protein [Phycisphaerales bacterium]